MSTPRDPLDLISRAAIVLGGGLLLAWLTTWYLPSRQPAVLATAQQLLGEAWYRIEMGDEHLGYMYNHVHKDLAGQWVFETTTHFVTQAAHRVTISKTLRFGSSPPFALIHADYHSQDGPTLHRAQITPLREHYTATSTGPHGERTQDLPWHYGLDDFLAFETWLTTKAPAPGETHGVQNIDFERLRITRKRYQVLERGTEYVVSTTSPFAPTITRLGSDLKPRQLTMVGVFDIERSNEAEATAIKEMRHATHYQFALDRRLQNSAALSSLTLKAPTHLPTNFPRYLRAVTTPASTAASSEFLGEEPPYPIRDSRVQKLVQTAVKAVRQDTERDLVQQLLNAAHNRLTYAEGAPSGSVHRALTLGTGECTDFADLFTTLGRAAGLPTRTVYGLAYKDGTSPAMMFHAWNEIYVDSSWQSVDPTWGQRQADATHLKLNDYLSALLILAHNKQPVTFEVAALDYN